MKIVVVGATGYIGSRLLAAGRIRGDVLGTSSRKGGTMAHLDLGTPGSFDYSEIFPGDAVFLAAAISSPDVCALQRDLAWAVNVSGTSEVIERVIARGARVVLFSSDTVYGARDDMFDEAAPCDPAGEYAIMKHEVEKRFLGSPLFKTFRLSYVFSRFDKFTQYLLNCQRSGTAAELFHPFYRAVVHLDDVISAALALADRWGEIATATVNAGGPEVVSRIDIAAAVRDAAAPGLAWTVATPPPDFFVNRPPAIRMRSPWMATLLGRPARSLSESAAVEFSPSA